MEIFNGLMDRQVLQRNSRDVCDVLVSGKCSAAGRIRMRLVKDGRAVRGLAGKTLARVKKGRFSFRLRGIPVGGPYDITLTLIDFKGGLCGQVDVKDVMVGDVWILGGQSNMEGIGPLKDAEKPDKMVRAFYMDDHWDTARDPIHKLSVAVDQIHLDIEGGKPHDRGKHIGTGLGVSFGKKMYGLTGVPQGLICCAHGGSPMEWWDPALKKKGSKSLYGAMFRRFVKNGSNAAGMLWYQGEADSGIEPAALYTKRMKRFIKAFRRDFSKDKLPLAMVQISRYHVQLPQEAGGICPQGWNSVQYQQMLLQQTVEKLSTVPAVDLSLSDAIHLDGESQKRLGRRLADAMFVLTNGHKAGKGQIQPASIGAAVRTRLRKPAMDYWDIEVKFKNVQGHLTAQGRPAGFSLVDAYGNICDVIYRTDIERNRVILRTELSADESHNLYLHYGYGTGPYCNITDAADRSLPVFGPCEIQWNKNRVSNKR